MRPKGQIFDLKAFRARYRLTQKEIAEAVNRPQSFLSAIEHGKRSAPPGFLDDLSSIYKVDNISDYLHDREDVETEDISNIRNAIVNSPHGMMLLNEFGSKLLVKDIMRILEMQQGESHSTPQAPQAPSDSSTVAELVRLLADAQARCNKAEDRVRELEKQVQDLQAQLPKKKR